MNKTNFKIELLQKMVAFLNDTVVNEDESKDSKQDEQPIDPIKDAEVPEKVYELEDGVVLNVYEGGKIEPQLEDGIYKVENAEEDEKDIFVVIENGLFKEETAKDKPEPSADPIEENLPVVQEDEEKKEEEEPTEEPKEEETDDETKKALDEALAKIAELEAKIAELEAALSGKNEEISQLRKLPTSPKVDTPKVETGDKYTKLVQALNKK